MGMWKPVDCDTSNVIIKNYAKLGIEKEIKKLNKKIDRMTKSLSAAFDNGATTRRMSSMKCSLSAECSQRDRFLEALKHLEEVEND